MSIHEHLTPQAQKDLKEVGWTKGLELAKVARGFSTSVSLLPLHIRHLFRGLCCLKVVSHW